VGFIAAKHDRTAKAPVAQACGCSCSGFSRADNHYTFGCNRRTSGNVNQNQAAFDLHGIGLQINADGRALGVARAVLDLIGTP